MARPETPRVAVLVETSVDWGRRLIRGIVCYAQKHGPWELLIEAGGEGESRRLPPRWAGEGIIARVASRATSASVTVAGVPVVNVSAIHLKGVNLPRVTTDVRSWAQTAAEHFFDRGLRNFAYVAPGPFSSLEGHRRAFGEVLAEKGHPCFSYGLSRRGERGTRGQTEPKDLVRWLKGLPKPVGILAWPMKSGQEVVEACRRAGILVPETVAVLSGDEDELLCGVCSPPLSGIVVPSERIGYEAAALLDRLMRGRRPPRAPVLIQPTGIVTRQSTDVLTIDDADVTRAVRFIRDHAAEPIRVQDVVRAVAISRSRLERRFRAALGRAPGAEIRRVHLERAKQLLVGTDLPIPRVAAAAGFCSPEYLAYVIKSETGLSPYRYRAEVRGR